MCACVRVCPNELGLSRRHVSDSRPVNCRRLARPRTGAASPGWRRGELVKIKIGVKQEVVIGSPGNGCRSL